MTPATQHADADALIRMEDQWGAHNYHPLDIVIERGEGDVMLFRTSAYSARRNRTPRPLREPPLRADRQPVSRTGKVD
ncbi:MAG: hypothetical protein ABIV11_10470 [Gemmatimonadaceae bacterium]